MVRRGERNEKVADLLAVSIETECGDIFFCGSLKKSSVG
jgi:hypothetical protein